MTGLDKAIVKRSRLRNKFLSNRPDLSRKEYIKTTKILRKLFEKMKKKKKTFWKSWCKFYDR